MKNARNPKRLLGAPYMSMDGINEKGFSCAVLEIKAKATKQNMVRSEAIMALLIC